MADIEISVNDAIATVTINRPAKRNALTLAMWKGVAAAFDELGRDRAVRAIILTGAGGNFSVGADIIEFGQVRNSEAGVAEYERAVDGSGVSIMAAPKPTIAAIDGYGLGGGCHLALACDFRFARSGAVLGIPAARLSIVYGVGSTQRLLALVGLSEAKRILFSARQIQADEALRIGLVDRIEDDVVAAARAFALEMADNAPLSIAGSKKILDGLTSGPGTLDLKEIDATIVRAMTSRDYAEGRQAFVEKRRPRFTGT